MTTLAAFLGTSDYVPVHYQLGEDARTSSPQKYTQVALLELLDERPDRVCLLVTEDARSKNLGMPDGTLLLGQLAAAGYSEDEGNLDVVEIPPGSSRDELWNVFDTLGDSLSGDVIFDCTHGFRSLPVVTMPALQFLQALDEINLVGLFYGAFEVLGPAHKVKADQASGRETPAAPIFDLTAMLDIPLWAQAVAEWKRTGRAQGLESLLRGPSDRLGKALGSKSPTELRGLPSKLGALSDALAIVNAREIERTARELNEALKAVASQIQAHEVPELRPFIPIIKGLQRSISQLVVPGAYTERPRGSARFLLDLARWYLDRERYPEAATCAREAVTDLFVDIAIEAGVKAITRGDRELGPDTSAYRSRVDGLFLRHAVKSKGASEARETNADAIDVTNDDAATRIDALMSASMDLQSILSGVNALREHRNKPMHAYTGDHTASKLKRNKEEQRVKLHGDLKDDLVTVESLLRLVECGALFHRDETVETDPAHGG